MTNEPEPIGPENTRAALRIIRETLGPPGALEARDIGSGLRPFFSLRR
jgi:hypothetical protein